MSLVVTDIEKRYARFPALKGVSLATEPGEFLALLGPSGSGKTTLLRVLAGLEIPDAGGVSFDGADFLAMSPRERRIGMVFQHYALFRHMNVARNIAFGLKVLPSKLRPKGEEIERTVARLLSLVQLDGLGHRFPAQLSGGQQQRVALARALAIEPRLLLLDEPFGALDAKVRKDLRHWLRRVHDETGVTTIFVTHDQEEAMDLADRVAVLREGRIEQIGAPQALEQEPASAFVFDFLGESNSLLAKIEGPRACFGDFSAPVAAPEGLSGPAVAWFRPHETRLEREGHGLPVVVTGAVAKGAVLRLDCRAEDGRTFVADYPRGLPPAAGVGETAKLRPVRTYAFAEG
jgi:sulfate transport system ATP-binding protein